MNQTTLHSLFTYHAPHGDQAQRYERLRAGGLVLARLINDLAPESAETTLAIRRVQEAVMYANAAIACNEAKPASAAPEPLQTCGLCGLLILNGQLFEGDGTGRSAHVTCLDKRGR